jgi:hypothetical protein
MKVLFLLALIHVCSAGPTEFQKQIQNLRNTVHGLTLHLASMQQRQQIVSLIQLANAHNTDAGLQMSIYVLDMQIANVQQILVENTGLILELEMEQQIEEKIQQNATTVGALYDPPAPNENKDQRTTRRRNINKRISRRKRNGMYVCVCVYMCVCVCV